MASFHTKTFSKHDDYMTPKYAWENINMYIPKDKIIDVMNRLRELDKPFIIIMPCSKICTSYFRGNFKDTENHIQIIIPRKRIHFQKIVDGSPVITENKCNFDCFYYCYKMNLERDIMWLD